MKYKIFYINLDRVPERRVFMNNEFQKVGLTARSGFLPLMPRSKVPYLMWVFGRVLVIVGHCQKARSRVLKAIGRYGSWRWILELMLP